jgi:hypothetical protein
LLNIGKIVIPLFQRSYCWGEGMTKFKATHASSGKEEALTEGWWRDVTHATKQDPHRIGKIIFYRDRHTPSDGPKTMLAIDG